MFRTMSGYRAPFHDLTLMVIAEFNEWHVMISGTGVTIQGRRQFNENSAKQHAITIAQQYLQEHRHDESPMSGDVEWTPTAKEDWLVWS